MGPSHSKPVRPIVAALVLAACGLSPLHAALIPSADGLTVYDTVNNVTWLADFNLPADNRFTLPLCAPSNTAPCVNASGSMNYASAAAWVAALNAANYLGHTNWQLPTTPTTDRGCTKTGPNGNSFSFGCSASALGSLYYNALALHAPDTAVPIPASTAGPFRNLQPYLYWSRTSQGGNGFSTFSFDTGWQGANTTPHVMYVLPMIPGKIPGTPATAGNALQVNPGGQTVYDPVSNVTWLADANLAASNSLGLPPCQSATAPAICVNPDGAMNWDSAAQFVANMNNGSGYLGQTTWQIPPVDPNCSGYDCGGSANPMGELFYNQFGLAKGMAAVATPSITVGAFHNIQPYLYWSCLGATVQAACESAGPAPNFEWSFSFGNGFEGTDLLANDLFATAYFPGRLAASSGPVIAEVANAEGEAPVIAPNTWVEIKGGSLAPPGDSRIWQSADFHGAQMPTQLDQVGVTVNGKSAYVYYISPSQINILTPPDALSGSVQVVVTSGGTAGAAFTAKAQTISPSFFVFNGGPYVAAVHADGTLIGPATLYPGASTPAHPGEEIMLYANGFGATSVPVQAGSSIQSGTLAPLPVIRVGNIVANVKFAGLVAPGEFQFNIVVPPSLPNGDQSVTATFSGLTTPAANLITIHN